MKTHYLKLPSQTIFSPKWTRNSSVGSAKSHRRILSHFPKSTKYSSQTVNDLFSTNNNYNKNKSSIFFSSNNCNITTSKFTLMKKKYRTLHSSKVGQSSLQKFFPIYSRRPRKNPAMTFCYENEELYEETHQIKNVVKRLEKKLFFLSQENMIKDVVINQREQQINKIINAFYEKMKLFKEENDEDCNTNYNSNNINAKKIKKFDPSMGALVTNIKKEIKNIDNEITTENKKIKNFKKSLLITKMNELTIEA